MPEDLVDIALRMVDRLEAADIAAIRADLAEHLAEWDPAPWIVERWRPQLDDFAGLNRRVTHTRQISDVMARVAFDGDRGQAFVSVLFDETAKVSGLAVDQDERDGRFWVVVGSMEDQRDELQAFYTMLTSGPIGYGEGGGSHPPRWRDPAHPTQIHLDVSVPDLQAAECAVLDHGARKLEEFPAWRVYADPAGHPFCLYAGDRRPVARLGELTRVVIDCADPAALARFWDAMLDMPRRVEESPDRVVVARDDLSLPMIALQRVAGYQPPHWPDPKHPAQMHFDLGFDNRPQKERLALELGAIRLPPQGGSCPVYADPAGHPFCLCYKGE